MSQVLEAPSPVQTSTAESISSRDVDDISLLPVYRWSVQDFQKLVREGYFCDTRVELLRGVIVPKMVQNAPHCWTIQELTAILAKLLPSGWKLRVQLAVSTEDSQPEPDFAIVVDRGVAFASRHPSSGDFAIMIEVADSSHYRDRLKISIYAEAGVPEYWIVDISQRSVNVLTQPDRAAGRYRKTLTYTADQSVPLKLEDRLVAEILLASFLPPDPTKQ